MKDNSVCFCKKRQSISAVLLVDMLAGITAVAPILDATFVAVQVGATLPATGPVVVEPEVAEMAAIPHNCGYWLQQSKLPAA